MWVLTRAVAITDFRNILFSLRWIGEYGAVLGEIVTIN